MDVGIYNREDIAGAILSDVLTLLATAAAMGQNNIDFIKGGLTVSRSQAVRFGISWPALLDRARAQLNDGLIELLDTHGREHGY